MPEGRKKELLDLRKSNSSSVYLFGKKGLLRNYQRRLYHSNSTDFVLAEYLYIVRIHKVLNNWMLIHMDNLRKTMNSPFLLSLSLCHFILENA